VNNLLGFCDRWEIGLKRDRRQLGKQLQIVGDEKEEKRMKSNA
jgi:hypothetical protein